MKTGRKEKTLQIFFLCIVWIMLFSVTVKADIVSERTAAQVEEVQTGWKDIGKERYYYENGKAVTGWKTIAGKRYYFSSSGKLKKGIITVNSKRYLLHPQTGVALRGWHNIGNKRYCASADSSLAVNRWALIKGKYYFFRKDSSLFTGGWVNMNGYRFYSNSKGERVTGIRKIDGKQYYFTPTGKLVVNKAAYNINGKYYKISSSGVLKPFSKVENMAIKQVKAAGGTLYDAFLWSAFTLQYYRNSDYVPAGMDAAAYFGEYGFTYGRGDCHVMACTFYWMAKVLGYDAHYVSGIVPLARGGWGDHGWVEIDQNGGTYVYDPDYAMNVGGGGFKFTYDSPGAWTYVQRTRRN